MTARQVASVLYDIQTFLELNGEDDFRSRAYARAARTLEGTDLDMDDPAAIHSVAALPGIGRTLAGEIAQIAETGTSPVLEEFRARTPIGLIDITAVRGLGGKKVRALHQGLGIKSLDELESACREGRVAGLTGFGAKSQEKILGAIVELKRNLGRFRIDTALRLGDSLVDGLRALPSVHRAELAGRARRGGEEFEALIPVVATSDPNRLVRELSADGLLTDVREDHGEIRGIAEERYTVRIQTVRSPDFACALHLRTGSRPYLEKFSQQLASRGVDRDGCMLRRDGVRIHVGSEEELFELAGMQYVPPELREGLDEVERAVAASIPRLVDANDLKGMLHVHSRWSDGRHSIPELAERCVELGYRYLLICDHSKAAFYANGLDEHRLEQQGREIDEINKRYEPERFRILKGVECDILADGALDLSEDALAALDAVVVSIHSRFELPVEAQTARVCSALANPYTTILGHSTGRLILSRKGYEVELEKVVATAAESGRSIELNCNPYRLDLPWPFVRMARDRGVKIAINPDAHTLQDFANMRYGVLIGRKGWLTAADVVNTMTADEFIAWAARLREGRR